MRDALASLEPSTLPQVARRWASVEFDVAAGDSLTLFLVALRELARRADADGNRLSCCMSPTAGWSFLYSTDS